MSSVFMEVMKDKEVRLRLAVAAFALVAANNPAWQDVEGAEKFLESTRLDLKVKDVGGYCWFSGFGSKDLYKTKFTAMTAQGELVDGCVTHQLFLNADDSTVRDIKPHEKTGGYARGHNY